jgi:EAL domain-containing protein (putative c-di-GMP-specific phosphodiesterase class I)/CheY-like chemotaxis protein
MPPQQKSARGAWKREIVRFLLRHSLALLLPIACLQLEGRFDMNKTKPRVLIIDDDDEIRDILDELLSRSYDCTTSSSAADALTLLATESFDLILSDISMPEMTGLEMMPYLANLAPRSVVVMISGQLMIESAIGAMRSGAFDYITKPFDLAQVKSVVKRALDHGRQLHNSNAGANLKDKAVERLRNALRDDAFVVHYQPQVDIQSGRVVGAEALVRWDDRENGLRLPGEFIPLAEETGLIVELGETVLRAACAQARRWHAAGLTDFQVAVNVSPQQLQQEHFADTVAEVLETTGLPARNLEIEVTETSLMQDPEAGIRTLNALRSMGVKIAIDDFGTGYSSLGYLKRLPIDSVKLDASFVKDATRHPDDAALVMAIITLAHNLRKKVIAEGIESADQLAFLRLLRCDEGQGYFLGRPGRSEELNLASASRKVTGFPEVILSASFGANQYAAA